MTIDDSRCECGGRYFEHTKFLVTCKDGRAFHVFGVDKVRCCTCGAEYVYPVSWPKQSGKKRLIPIVKVAGQYFVDTGDPDVKPSLTSFLDKVADELIKEHGQDVPFHKVNKEDLE